MGTNCVVLLRDRRNLFRRLGRYEELRCATQPIHLVEHRVRFRDDRKDVGLGDAPQERYRLSKEFSVEVWEHGGPHESSHRSKRGRKPARQRFVRFSEQHDDIGVCGKLRLYVVR